ncbi:MAG: DUF167 domain-containing protein [Gemmataceae bacterium]|nr:DUF167 domain-containing protein [Gemmataceae bacterium]MCI0741116.1 DUF167 domain-containing protein [Gemmataceae bacterium]
MIQIQDHEEGCVLSVRAQPGARRNGLVGEQNNALKVAVTAPPDQGKANQAIVELLREELNLKRSQVAILSGLTSRDKRILIRGIKAAELAKKLELLLHDG